MQKVVDGFSLDPAPDVLNDKNRNWFNDVGEKIFASHETVAQKALIDSDPRIVAIDAGIKQSKTEREQIEGAIVELTHQINIATDPVQKNKLTKELNDKNQAKQEKVNEIRKKEDVKKKFHRMISTEIQQKTHQ